MGSALGTTLFKWAIYETIEIDEPERSKYINQLYDNYVKNSNVVKIDRVAKNWSSYHTSKMRQFFEDVLNKKSKLKARIYVHKYKFYPYNTQTVVAVMESLEQSKIIRSDDLSGQAISLRFNDTGLFDGSQFTKINWTGEYYEDKLCGSIKYN